MSVRSYQMTKNSTIDFIEANVMLHLVKCTKCSENFLVYCIKILSYM